MNIVELNKYGTQLTSKTLALKIRRSKLTLKNDKEILIDFSDIETATYGFLDELIGSVITYDSLDFFKNHYRIINANSKIETTIKGVISYRTNLKKRAHHLY